MCDCHFGVSAVNYPDTDFPCKIIFHEYDDLICQKCITCMFLENEIVFDKFIVKNILIIF